MYSPDSSSVTPPEVNDSLFTPITPELYGDKGKIKVKSGQFLLSASEKYLLEWALMGFLPTGPEGFNPRPG